MQLYSSLSILCHWHSLSLPFFGIGMKTDLFQSCGHCWVFQMCWHIECSTFTASSFRTWNSSSGIPSPPWALFIVMLPKALLTSHSRMSNSGEWSHHHDYLCREDLTLRLTQKQEELHGAGCWVWFSNRACVFRVYQGRKSKPNPGFPYSMPQYSRQIIF